MNRENHQAAEVFALDLSDRRIAGGYVVALNTRPDPAHDALVRDKIILEFGLQLTEADVILGAALHDIAELDAL
jgi:hypothetical protein